MAADENGRGRGKGSPVPASFEGHPAMHDPEPTPRPDLFTNGDAEAWCEQFLFLRYTVRMSPERIAQIDYGLDPDHPDAWAAAAFWGPHIERHHPWVDVRRLWRRHAP